MRKKTMTTIIPLTQNPEYVKLLQDFDKLSKDYYGNPYSLNYYSGFKSSTNSTLKGHSDVIEGLVQRVKELEKILKLAGIVEELDTTDVVKLPDTNPYTTIILGDGSIADSKKQYVVNKVK